ncbi:hypothetical protein PHJA_000721600 [Phtheirospermum japonicum]|uniref:Uncharacterized protein n=1 Tax=Phtheirospermum japonicum TaxID=374723 RepID=A0A830BK22_9LAMI|nr:hypothetical protein PHJA_000721600 [Phtheirospermum japonicum]
MESGSKFSPNIISLTLIITIVFILFRSFLQVPRFGSRHLLIRPISFFFSQSWSLFGHKDNRFLGQGRPDRWLPVIGNGTTRRIIVLLRSYFDFRFPFAAAGKVTLTGNAQPLLGMLGMEYLKTAAE